MFRNSSQKKFVAIALAAAVVLPSTVVGSALADAPKKPSKAQKQKSKSQLKKENLRLKKQIKKLKKKKKSVKKKKTSKKITVKSTPYAVSPTQAATPSASSATPAASAPSPSAPATPAAPSAPPASTPAPPVGPAAPPETPLSARFVWLNSGGTIANQSGGFRSIVPAVRSIGSGTYMVDAGFDLRSKVIHVSVLDRSLVATTRVCFSDTSCSSVLSGVNGTTPRTYFRVQLSNPVTGRTDDSGMRITFTEAPRTTPGPATTITLLR